MRLIIGIWHPAHVHFFKNLIWDLENKGHEIQIVTREKEITINLLDAYGFNYKIIGIHHKKTIGKGSGMIKTDYNLYKIAKKFKPDILTGIMDMYSAHVGKLIGKPSIIFSDTEHGIVYNRLTFPFASTICTPSCFKKDLGKKQVRYKGYHELAYLHPNYFKPDPSVLDGLGLSKDDKIIVLRFVSWSASHDIGQRGISPQMRIEYISKLAHYGRIFITSEGEQRKEFEKWNLEIAPEKFHSLLSYAQLYIGEGGSTATEAAILGTPSIHISTTAKFCGVFDDLHNIYNLIYTFSDDHQALEKAINILEDPSGGKKWMLGREKMLKEKIDVTTFITDFIENYPESFYELKEKERGG